MQKKQLWLLIGVGILILLAAAAVILWCFLPRQINIQTQGLLIHSDGTTEISQVQISGTWQPTPFDDSDLRRFTGRIRVEGLPWLTGDTLDENHISFTEDLWDADLLFGCDFIHEQDTPTMRGNVWVLTNEKMDGFIMIATENGASNATWVVVPAQNIQEAIALRDAWNLPTTDFNWEP